jgi:hypothetical protein
MALILVSAIPFSLEAIDEIEKNKIQLFPECR